MVICHKCKADKEETEFNFNSAKKRREYYCKKCHSDYLKSHYRRNKEYYQEKSTRRGKELRAWLFEYKSKLSCQKCGENHPACIDFHHPDDNKIIEIADMTRHKFSIDKMLAEIKKCIPLCANCHRKLHYEEKSGPWLKRTPTNNI